MPGVAALIAQGFTPIEDLTGAHDIATVWPEEHRRSIPEVREWALDNPRAQQRLWAVRAPWPGWTLRDVFTYLWSMVDHYRDAEERLRAAANALRADEQEARRQLDRARPPGDT